MIGEAREPRRAVGDIKNTTSPLTDLNRRLTIPMHSYPQMATEPDLAGAGSRLEGRPASRPGGFLI